MAIDSLQAKIRRTKSVLAVDLTVFPEDIPPLYRDKNTSDAVAVRKYAGDLLNILKDSIPAVRFDFSTYALLGEEGLSCLRALLRKADSMGYYILLDAPKIHSQSMADFTARSFLGKGTEYPCDALLVSAYPGSDIIKPFLPYCANEKKDLFAIVRTANKSASEIQDLLSGSRLAHAAAADYVNRYAQDYVGKSGYSSVAVSASATSSDSLKALRMRYNKLFILVDGLDAAGANAKNCAQAFDALGYGALVCVGQSVIASWKKQEETNADPVQAAKDTVIRYCKNLSRYITVR